MALIYSWESFIRIHGGEPGARDVFEKLMDELLRAENPEKEVHIVKAVQGDGGIDVYVHQEDGIDIYQCKFFMESMNSSRWKQVFKSFSKAMESKGVKVLRWVLCMPREMQKDDITKWNAFKEDRKSYGVEIQFVDGNEIIQRMEKCDRNKGTNLIERYFGGTREPLSSNNIIESIRKASITQRAEIFKGRNKFNGLEIFEDLIPLAVSEKGFDEPVGIDADGIETPLYDYFNKYENDDLMLIGEGGIGKTTFLAHLMKTITPETDPAIVPIYIELNCCPQEIGNWFVDADKKSNFITRYIASLINHRDLGQYTVSELDGIEYALSHRSDAVYLLLLV